MENEWQYLQLLLVSSALGGVIGLERELLKKPAGLKTHMLVSATATALIAFGDLVLAKFSGFNPNTMITADPIRIAQAIIIGIGFVGGGTIIKDVQNKEALNLTTAASILFTSAVGMIVGLEKYILATGMALLALFINFGIGTLEKKIPSKNQK